MNIRDFKFVYSVWISLLTTLVTNFSHLFVADVVHENLRYAQFRQRVQSEHFRETCTYLLSLCLFFSCPRISNRFTLDLVLRVQNSNFIGEFDLPLYLIKARDAEHNADVKILSYSQNYSSRNNVSTNYNSACLRNIASFWNRSGYKGYLTKQILK
jgi:hypothetical protein